MGQPQSLFIELGRWRDKAAKRGKTCTFTSDIIPDWLNAEIVAAMDVVGHEHAFSFLKQMDDARMAAERRLKRKIQRVLKDYEAKVARAVRAGRDPDYDKLFEELRAAVQPEIAALAVDEAMRLSADVGIVFDPTIISEEAVRWARDYSYKLVTGLTDTTRKLVSGVAQSFIETPGMTQGDITRLLQPAFGEVRAQLISVTELTRAYSEATNEIQRRVNQTGLQMDRIWHSARDDRVCPICGPLDGLPESEWRGQFPKGPPGHPGCRCAAGLSAAGDKFHIKEGIELGKERIEMLDEMGETDKAEAARQKLKELRERVRVL